MEGDGLIEDNRRRRLEQSGNRGFWRKAGNSARISREYLGTMHWMCPNIGEGQGFLYNKNKEKLQNTVVFCLEVVGCLPNRGF